MTISILGIDSAKHTFQLHGADHAGKAVLKRRLSRHKLTTYVANLPLCTIVMDNGPEMTSEAMFIWSQRTDVKLHFIQPGKPTQNAFVESFNGRF